MHIYMLYTLIFLPFLLALYSETCVLVCIYILYNLIFLLFPFVSFQVAQFPNTAPVVAGNLAS